MQFTKAIRPLQGTVTVPGDKSVSHRAVMLGAISDGTTEITNFLPGADCLSTIRCFRQMGIGIELSEDKKHVLVRGRGLHGLQAPDEVLDCGNSGTTMRLMSGILAGQPFSSVLTGDDSIRKRPMKRVILPLTQMGADIHSEQDSGCAPLTIRGLSGSGSAGEGTFFHKDRLHGITYHSPVASAQVKSCVLLAGLCADSPVIVTEPSLSRNHTELMLASFGADVYTGTFSKVLPAVSAAAEPYLSEYAAAEYLTGTAAYANLSESSAKAGTFFNESASAAGAPDSSVSASAFLKGSADAAAFLKSSSGAASFLKDSASAAAFLNSSAASAELLMHEEYRNLPAAAVMPDPKLEGGSVRVPGDISSAAYFLCAALLVPGSHITLKNVGINPTRTGILRVAEAMGADIVICARTESGGEPAADLEVRYSPLHGTVIEGDLIPTLIDELPVIAVLAACAEGDTIIRDAGELRVKESDRLAIIIENLQAMGVSVEPLDDGMIIHGGQPLHGAVLDSHEDHRIAMSFAVAALTATGDTEIRNAECVRISYPGFYTDLAGLQ